MKVIYLALLLLIAASAVLAKKKQRNGAPDDGDEDFGISGLFEEAPISSLDSMPTAYSSGFCEWKHVGCFKRRGGAFFEVTYVPKLKKASSCLNVCYLYVSFALPRRIYSEADTEEEQCECKFRSEINTGSLQRCACADCPAGDKVDKCGNSQVMSIYTCEGGQIASAIGARKRTLVTWKQRSALIPPKSPANQGLSQWRKSQQQQSSSVKKQMGFQQKQQQQSSMRKQSSSNTNSRSYNSRTSN